MFNPVVAILRLIAFLGVTLVMLPPYLAVSGRGRRRQMRIASAYWRMIARLFGMRVRFWGTPLAEGPALLVSNHASYLDIIVLGGLLPAFFVAKSEVAGWPGLGFLARIAHTVFVDRSRGATLRERDGMRARLESGDQLILFPEGTSDDGNGVLPFKSSFFAVVEQKVMHGGSPCPVPVQPISLAYTRLDGLPMQRAFRPFYAWYGSMTLADHLFAALGLGNATIDVVFHPPVSIDDFRDRKALANHCHDVIHHGVGLALAGRLSPDGTAPVPHRKPPPPPAG